MEYLPRIHHIAALQQSPRIHVKNERRTRRFHRTDYLHVDVQRHLVEIYRQQKRMRVRCSTRLCAQRFGAGQWSFLRPVSEKKWYSTREGSPQGEWDKIAELMMVKFTESGHPVFRATSPLSRGVLKSKGGGQLSIHYCVDPGTIETVFAPVNQLSLYGAVAEMCEECESCHDRTGRLVVEGQSNPLFVPSVMKTNILLTDDPAQEEDLLRM